MNIFKTEPKCNIMYDILSKDGASYTNAIATLSNGRIIKINGGGTVVVTEIVM
jgi:hypothetical protein